MPKSRTFAVPSGSTMMLDGLTSRCTMPHSCARPRPLRDLQRDGQRLVEREPAALQSRLQRFPFVERHRDEQLSVLGLADLIDRADVRMIERRRGARFRHESRLWRRRRRSDAAAETSARPDGRAARPAPCRPRPFRRRPAAPVRSSAPSAGPPTRLPAPASQALGFTSGASRSTTPGAVVREQQRLDLLPEREVIAAAGVEQRPPLGVGAVDRVGEHVLDLLPPIAGAIDARASVGRLIACSSRFSHARAVAHSRLTVAGETCSVSAVSSTLMPP